MTFRLTPLAEADLAEILDHISSKSSPDRAEAVLLEFVKAAGKLADMPRMGHARTDLSDEPVLFWPVYGYLIVYRPDVRPLQVVRVVHGSRDPRALQASIRIPPDRG